MFLYINGSKKFNFFVDNFISSVTIFAIIYDTVIFIGYILLSFTKAYSCHIKPSLQIYMDFAGYLSIFTLIILLIAFLMSPSHTEECLFISSSETSR